MQNKAEAQPAWLQLAAGAAAGAYLSLVISTIEGANHVTGYNVKEMLSKDNQIEIKG